MTMSVMEIRTAALNAAALTVSANGVGTCHATNTKDILTRADKFYEWLKGPLIQAQIAPDH
jgi:hypothetical protein